MSKFEATHEITLTASDGSCRTLEVQLVDGAARSRVEHDRSAAAQWTCVDGEWSFLGAPLPPGVTSASITTVARSGFERLAWELSDPRRGIARDGDRLVLCRRDGAPALWLELAEDRLRLVDRGVGVALDPGTTDRRIREIVVEWRVDSTAKGHESHR